MMKKFVQAHVTNAFIRTELDQNGRQFYIFAVVGFDGTISRFKIVPDGSFAGQEKYYVFRLFYSLEIPLNQVVPMFGEAQAIGLCLKAKKSEWYS